MVGKINYFRQQSLYGLIMQILYWEIKYHISNKNIGSHMTSKLNKAINMIEQASVLSGEEKSVIDSVWSLILVKSNQYTVEGFDLAEINYMLCFLVTSNYSCLCFRKIVLIKLANIIL